jgi:hypothetical protein
MRRLFLERMVLPLAGLLVLCSTASGVEYFPPLAFSDNPGMDGRIREWYSRQLKALDEPSLWEFSKTSTGQAYRFLWLRSFHHPVAVRLNVREDGTGLLTVKEADGAGGYEPGKLVVNRTMEISKQRMQLFLGKMADLDYWNLPTREEKWKSAMQCDGAEWVLEGVRGAKYKVVERRSPGDGPVRELGLFLVFELAGIKVPAAEVY